MSSPTTAAEKFLRTIARSKASKLRGQRYRVEQWGFALYVYDRKEKLYRNVEWYCR